MFETLKHSYYILGIIFSQHFDPDKHNFFYFFWSILCDVMNENIFYFLYNVPLLQESPCQCWQFYSFYNLLFYVFSQCSVGGDLIFKLDLINIQQKSCLWLTHVHWHWIKVWNFKIFTFFIVSPSCRRVSTCIMVNLFVVGSVIFYFHK